MIRLSRQLQAGDLIHLFAVEEPIETQPPGKVSKVTTWREVARKWAALFVEGSKEVWNARQYNSEAELVVVCRGRTSITDKMRLNQQGRVLDILGVQGADGKTPANAEWLYLLCKEGTSKGS